MNEVRVTKYQHWEIVVSAKAAIKLQKGVFENMAFSLFGELGQPFIRRTVR